MPLHVAAWLTAPASLAATCPMQMRLLGRSRQLARPVLGSRSKTGLSVVAMAKKKGGKKEGGEEGGEQGRWGRGAGGRAMEAAGW